MAGAAGGYDIKFIKNESTRVTTKCKEKKCGFRIHASNMQYEKTFQVKSITPKHDYHRAYNNHLVTFSYIANKYINKLRVDPYVKVDSFKKEIRRELTVDVSKWQLYRAKKKAREVIDKDMVEQYNRLVDYLETVRYGSNSTSIDEPAGRPRKLRRKGPEDVEDEDVNKVSIRFTVITCAKCLQRGHNLRSCKKAIHPNSKLLKKKETPQAPGREKLQMVGGKGSGAAAGRRGGRGRGRETGKGRGRGWTPTRLT
ncbi:hypothetical protein Vadar_021796 [Vaccinium darrowii]|uniref:Uncharacterized protein n=1 Tax=Vaccinium darrowii TaxID=229202 RepID=A0ACB7Z5F0_9ERIC|nr:hypothetical protein Vadar_021796 [Vaccinium darrowii]